MLKKSSWLNQKINISTKGILGFILLLISLSFSTCTFHVHVVKMKRGFINKIRSKQPQIVDGVLNEFKKDTVILVDSIKNYELRKMLINARVQRLSINYKIDSTNKNLFFRGTYLNIPLDSCIRFERFTKWHLLALDHWTNDNVVCVYFSKNKPLLMNKNGGTSDMIRKVNDSLYFFRFHHLNFD